MSEDGRPPIRRAVAADVEAIMRLAERSARISNAADYAPEQIEELVAAFSPERVARHVAERDVFVAVDDGGEPIGTAAYFEGRARAVFVDPDRQGRGVGAALMARVEHAARQHGVRVLEVRASLTAVGFYARRGYVRIRDLPEGVPTVLMEKAL